MRLLLVGGDSLNNSKVGLSVSEKLIVISLDFDIKLLFPLCLSSLCLFNFFSFQLLPNTSFKQPLELWFIT